MGAGSGWNGLVSCGVLWWIVVKNNIYICVVLFIVVIIILGPLNEAVVSCGFSCVRGAAWLLGLSRGCFDEGYCLCGVA